MALSLMRGFILGAPKPNTFQIPGSNCKSTYHQKAMTMLQKLNLGLKHFRKISHSPITCSGGKLPPIGTGDGTVININKTAPSSKKTNSKPSSSSNSERTSKSTSKGEANKQDTQQMSTTVASQTNEE